jgi:hypothetical protein
VNEITPDPAGVPMPEPSPYTDRRALSEAWYRALYGGSTGPAAGAAARANAPFAADAAAAARNACRQSASPAAATAARSVAKPARERQLRMTFTAQSRIFAGKPPARAPVRMLSRSRVVTRTVCRARLPDGHGIDLLVQQRGEVLRLVAIYDGRSAQRVAAALHRARTALLLRGVSAEIDTIRKGSS